MNCMTALVFVDTNVLVYARDARQPAKQSQAAALFERLWRERSGRTSIQVLSEYYVTVTRKLDPGIARADAWEDVQSFQSWRPLPIDGMLIHRARDVEHRHRLNWWDSLIVAAAQAQNCAILLSEDLQDGGVYGGVTVKNPFGSLVNEPVAEYAGSTLVTRSHPPRGRPRRSTPP
jgi:predicted nucleic acid-binding protein